MANKFYYPVTKETFHNYAASIFGPIQRGESITTVWVPMAGRRMWNKFLIENIHEFSQELPDYKKYLLVYIEPLDLTEESLAGYLRLMGKSLIEINRRKVKDEKLKEFLSGEELFDDEKASYSKLLEQLKRVLKEIVASGYEIVFFLGEFDELTFGNRIFYHNLKSVLDTFRPKLHFVFLVTEDLTTVEVTEQLGELNSATMENVLFIPICGNEDINYVLDHFAETLGYDFTGEHRKLIVELCGGHPFLIKVVTRVIAGYPGKKDDLKAINDEVLAHYEVLSVTRRLFNLRSEVEREILQGIVSGKTPKKSQDLKRLIDLGLVVTEGGNYHLFGKLFEYVVQKSTDKKEEVTPGVNGKIYLDREIGAICFAGNSIEEKFSRQEYDVLRAFLEDPGKLQSRDEIGEVLWGKESYEKYSDWAIDQVMSKLRKKLNGVGTSSKVVTIRGKGYKLVNN